MSGEANDEDVESAWQAVVDTEISSDAAEQDDEGDTQDDKRKCDDSTSDDSNHDNNTIFEALLEKAMSDDIVNDRITRQKLAELLDSADVVEVMRQRMWEVACQGTNDVSRYWKAHCFLSGWGVEKDAEQAVEEAEQGAGAGVVMCMNLLGWMYDTGTGVEQSDEAAVEWYRKAAEQGDATARYNLGVAYEQGGGVEQNDEAAVKWYLKAAEQGDANAQSNLGVMFEQGRGVEQSDEEAVKWYRKAWGADGCSSTGFWDMAHQRTVLGTLLTRRSG